MENLVENTVNILDLPVNVLNAKDTHITLQFLSLNMETRDAVIRITYKGKRGSKTMKLVTQSKLTVYAMNWLTKPKPIKDEHDRPTGKYSTGFQRYLDSCDMDMQTPLGKIAFSSLNGSEEYRENPFSVRFNQTYDYATIELVNMPFRIPIVARDPMTGQEKVTKYVYPRRRDNGHVLKLRKKHYQRIFVRS